MTRHRGFDKPTDDEQLHVLPHYVLAGVDECGSVEGQRNKVESGAVEILTRYVTTESLDISGRMIVINDCLDFRASSDDIQSQSLERKSGKPANKPSPGVKTPLCRCKAITSLQLISVDRPAGIPCPARWTQEFRPPTWQTQHLPGPANKTGNRISNTDHLNYLRGGSGRLPLPIRLLPLARQPSR